MIQTKVEFKGLRDIDTALAVLPAQLQRRVLRKGLQFAAEVLREGMLRRAPRAFIHRVVRRGRSYPVPLANAIAFRIRVRKDGDPTAQIGPRQIAFWGRFVERGTKFQSPRPFMQPTLVQDGQIAVAAFAAGAKQALEQLMRRVRRSTQAGGG